MEVFIWHFTFVRSKPTSLISCIRHAMTLWLMCILCWLDVFLGPPKVSNPRSVFGCFCTNFTPFPGGFRFLNVWYCGPGPWWFLMNDSINPINIHTVYHPCFHWSWVFCQCGEYLVWFFVMEDICHVHIGIWFQKWTYSKVAGNLVWRLPGVFLQIDSFFCNRKMDILVHLQLGQHTLRLLASNWGFCKIHLRGSEHFSAKRNIEVHRKWYPVWWKVDSATYQCLATQRHL